MMGDPFAFVDTFWGRLIVGFVFGAVLGSFATMLAYRLPRRQSIVFPRSHCPSCNTTLGVLDLVPLVSWVALKGRCRHCHTSIGTRYFLIELLISVLCALACLIIGFSLLLLFVFAFIVASIVFIFGYFTQRIGR